MSLSPFNERAGRVYTAKGMFNQIMKTEIKKNCKIAMLVPTSMGVRITPAMRQPVHVSDTYTMQATSAESNVLNISASLGLPTKVLTAFVKDSPIALYIKNELKKRGIAYEGKDVQIAGRIVGKRVMGKASFMHLLDRDGKMQVYVKRDDVGTDEYADFKKYDIGDIVGVAGFVFRTQTGEVSVHAKAITLLSKSLLPLPEKFHGLKDQDLRYRQRYVDLIVNPEVKRNFVIRSQFIKFLRNYLDNMNYIEVETPVLNTIAGGAAARARGDRREPRGEQNRDAR